ncbi:unnamed protein product [Adineta steineri]|uniref:Uncharacterized protein n=1 Tax=Adineta steineri TaxID=433720 RepID=A0A814XUW2_9BILA|nr:unnamed protein product [Adineta steineri]CAF3962233.1 unnamed protein product [Adineta steineri]
MYVSYYDKIVKYSLHPNGTLISPQGTIIISKKIPNPDDYYDNPPSTLSEIGGCYDLFVVQSNGNLYVSDSPDHRILLLTLDSTEWIVVAGGKSKGSSANQLKEPHGIFVDQHETIYIADYGNHRIQKWQKNSISGSTIAGHKGIIVNRSADDLFHPIGLSVFSNGDMMISDFETGRRGRLIYWPFNSTKPKKTIINEIYNVPHGSKSEWFLSTGWQVDQSTGHLYISESWKQNSSVGTRIRKFAHLECKSKNT